MRNVVSFLQIEMGPMAYDGSNIFTYRNIHGKRNLFLDLDEYPVMFLDFFISQTAF